MNVTQKGPLALLAATLLAGCSLPPLQLSDRNAPMAVARATLRPGGAAGGGGVELELSRVSGQARQDRTEDFRIGGGFEPGPAQLQHEARSESAQLVYHHRLFAGQQLEMAWFAGVAAGRLNWTTTDLGAPGRRGQVRVEWTGPTGGVSGRWNLAPGWFGEVRYAGTVINSSDDTGTRAKLELALGWQAAPTVQLRLGYSSTYLNLWPTASWSELAFSARGPFAGIVIGY
jgi:hypothetical protein